MQKWSVLQTSHETECACANDAPSVALGRFASAHSVTHSPARAAAPALLSACIIMIGPSA